MDEASANPYSSPAAEVSIPPRVTTFGELVPLWTWLTVAVLTAVFGTPADPICMLWALAYGLLSFCVGAVVGSRWHILLRIVLRRPCGASLPLFFLLL